MLFKPFIDHKIKELENCNGINCPNGTPNQYAEHISLQSLLRLLKLISQFLFGSLPKTILTLLITSIGIYLWTISKTSEEVRTDYTISRSENLIQPQNQARSQLIPYSKDNPNAKRAEQEILETLKKLPKWRNTKIDKAIIDKTHISGPDYITLKDAPNASPTTYRKWVELWKVSDPNKTQELEFRITFTLKPPKIEN
jgi:hypothetical protein